MSWFKFAHVVSLLDRKLARLSKTSPVFYEEKRKEKRFAHVAKIIQSTSKRWWRHFSMSSIIHRLLHGNQGLHNQYQGLEFSPNLNIIYDTLQVPDGVPMWTRCFDKRTLIAGQVENNSKSVNQIFVDITKLDGLKERKKNHQNVYYSDQEIWCGRKLQPKVMNELRYLDLYIEYAICLNEYIYIYTQFSKKNLTFNKNQ